MGVGRRASSAPAPARYRAGVAAPVPTIHPTGPEDAHAWCAFVAREQTRTYRDVMPPDFGTHRLAQVEADAVELAAEIATGRQRVVQAEVDGEIVGAAKAGRAPAAWEIAEGFVPVPADQQLDRLYLHPDHHGTGLADRLLAEVVLPGPVYLWLIHGNTRAERFYARRGFRMLPEDFVSGPTWGNVVMRRMLRD